MVDLTEVGKLSLDRVQKSIIHATYEDPNQGVLVAQGVRRATEETGQRLSIEGTQRDWDLRSGTCNHEGLANLHGSRVSFR